MRIDQEPETSADEASSLAATAQAQHREHSSSYSTSSNPEGQDLHDYSLQDSFARGHFGEGHPYNWTS
jgi:hypothetical protein